MLMRSSCTQMGPARKSPDGRIRELGNAESETTNNRMEMRAAIEGLGLLQEEKEKGAITVVTDSEYVRKGITEWIHGWKRRGWRTATIRVHRCWMCDPVSRLRYGMDIFLLTRWLTKCTCLLCGIMML